MTTKNKDEYNHDSSDTKDNHDDHNKYENYHATVTNRVKLQLWDVCYQLP